MPKRKKLPKVPDYEGMGKSPGVACVQKARPLQSLSETDMTLPELKILDAYLARIDSHDPSKRTVRLEKGELEQCLGISRILKDDLDKRLKHLFQVITVKDDSKRNGLKLVSLFEKAEAEQDENGLWQITLTCTQSAREYVFNIDNIGYLRYRLQNVVNLTSRYSYVLFLYLVDNRFRKSWTIGLDELKAMLNCTADTYNEYKRFNDLILKKCHNELSSKTDLRYAYEPVKTGRFVTAIRFTVDTLPKITLDDVGDECEQVVVPNEDGRALWEEAVDGYGFTEEQIETLREVLLVIPAYRMPQSTACDNIDLRRYHYMRIKVAELKNRAKVKNHYSYLLKMLKNDADIE